MSDDPTRARISRLERELRDAHQALWLVVAAAEGGQVFIPESSLISFDARYARLVTWPDRSRHGVVVTAVYEDVNA